MYMVMSLKREADVEVYAMVATIPMAWTDGMIGAVPVFDNYGDAEKYADGDCKIVEIAEISEEDEY